MILAAHGRSWLVKATCARFGIEVVTVPRGAGGGTPQFRARPIEGAVLALPGVKLEFRGWV